VCVCVCVCVCVSFVTPRETNIIDLWVSPFESMGLGCVCVCVCVCEGCLEGGEVGVSGWRSRLL
jgi:hypothetical protein